MIPGVLTPVLRQLAAGALLTEAEAEAAFGLVLDGMADPVQIGALLMALRVRGESGGEMLGALRAMRARMRTVTAPDGAVDVCGTGGDGCNTLNISTAVAFVLAGCGVPVAKHGNRAASSASGAADVLTALGIGANLPPDLQWKRCGCAFLHAPHYHPGLRLVAEARRALGVRTLFNRLGPLANPAGVQRQLLGVSDPALIDPMAALLNAAGTVKAWVVHGAGLDELTLAGANDVAACGAGVFRRFTLLPEDAGLPRAPVAAIAGGGPDANASALVALLAGVSGPYRDTVLFNTAAALVVAERVSTLSEGVAQARASIDTGRAAGVLAALRTLTAECGQTPG